MTNAHLGFVDAALARRLELTDAWRGVRYTECYAALHPAGDDPQDPLTRPSVLAVGGGYAIYVGPQSPVTGARGLGFSGPVTVEDLDQIEAFYFSRGAPAAVTACPLADESLLDRLRARGYTPQRFFSVLACPIAPTDPPPPPDWLSITRARPEEAELWVRVVAGGFEDSETPSPAALDILGPNFYAADGVPFLAWVEGVAVGGGGLYIAPTERAVELGGASTRPAFRRRGVQRALISARLAEARRQGCDLAGVLTEPGSDSQRNLQRIGFELAYTKVVLTKLR